MSLKFSVQLDFDTQLFVFFEDNYFIYKQSEVCVTDCSFLDDFFDDFNAVFHFSFALFDSGVVILNGLNFILKFLNVRLAFFKHFCVDICVFPIPPEYSPRTYSISFA